MVKQKGRPPKELKVEIKKEPEEIVNNKSFETTDKELAWKLINKGFVVNTVVKQHNCKLYIFKDNEKTIKEALNG